MKSKKNIAVIGSGLTAYQAVNGLLDRGYEVTVIDVGETLPDDKREIVKELRESSPDQWSHELIKKARSNNSIGGNSIPKKMLFGSDFIYAANRKFAPIKINNNQRPPLPNFAYGGFSLVWGAACLPIDDCDSGGWPIKKSDLEPFYRKILEEMPLTGENDGLSKSFPTYKQELGKLNQGAQGNSLLSDLNKAKYILEKNGVIFGQARLAVETVDSDKSKACNQCGMCFVGCPWDSIYTTVPYFRKLISEGKISYKNNSAVLEVEENKDSVVLKIIDTISYVERIEYFDAVFIACGPINTTRLMLNSAKLYDTPIALKESMKFAIPVIRINDSPNALNEKINTLASVFLETKVDKLSQHWVHAQLTPISDLFLRHFSLQPGQRYAILRKLAEPLLRRIMIAWIGVHSDHSSSVVLTLLKEKENGYHVLEINAKLNKKSHLIAKLISKNLFKKGILFKSIFIPNGIRIANPGSGTHCGGSFPMSSSPNGMFETDVLGRPFGWKNVYIVDSSVLPSIAGTTTAFTAMANARRIASQAFL